MIIEETTSTGKLVLTSSYFKDIMMIRKALADHAGNFAEFRGQRDKWREVEHTYYEQIYLLWRKGCQELTKKVEKMTDEQLAKYSKIKYYGVDKLKEAPTIDKVYYGRQNADDDVKFN